MGRFLIHIDAQDAQDFFRRRLACVPGHPQIRTRSSPESASPAAASRPDYPVHPVHRCSIYSPSRWICPVAGGGRPARRQTGVSQRGQAGFQRSRPPDTPHLTIGTTPPGARASRPHAVPSVAAQFPCDVAADRPAGGNRMGPAEAEAGRRCRLIPVEEMAEAAGGFVRAGRPRSRGASSHDRVTPTGQYCRSILAPLSLKEVHPSSCLFVFIRGSSSFPKQKRLAVSPLYDPPRRGGRGPDLSETTPCAWWLETGS